jgi:cysteinyl-tRNA synthetase
MARYWLHNGFLSMDSEKMSKSLGNVKLVHDLLKDWDGEVLRLALMSGHYRQPLDFTGALLEQSKATLDRLYNAMRRMKDAVTESVGAPAGVVAALCDDLNTPLALAELSALATAANKAEPPEWSRIKGEMLAAGALLGLLQRDPDDWARGDASDAARIDALVAARVAARKAKDFAAADRIRTELAAEGIEIMDGAAGSTWRRI